MNNNKIRAFIALDLPIETKNYITISLFELKKNFKFEDFKWVNTENLHITFAFFKEIDKLLAINKFQRLSFNIKTTPIVVFDKNIHNFRYKILYLKPDNYEFFLSIYQQIQSEFKEFMDIKEKFIPHLTIARVRNKLSFKDIKTIENFELPVIQFKPQEISLFQSVLLPTGPIYYKLKTITLS